MIMQTMALQTASEMPLFSVQTILITIQLVFVARNSLALYLVKLRGQTEGGAANSVPPFPIEDTDDVTVNLYTTTKSWNKA